MRNTRNSFFASVTALVLCFVMLAGSTFAWFTDVAISSGNVIQSGNLDIALMKGTPNGNGGWNWVENNGEAIFDYDRWEPGYTTTAVLAVENHGSLSAKWTAKLELDGTPTILADVIDIYVTSYHNYSTTRPDFKDGTWQKLGTVREVLDNDGLLLPGGTIDPGHRQPILVALNMREDAGNDYQDKDLGANFNIKILATQASVESDSYDNTYDEGAKWPDMIGFDTTASINQAQVVYGELVNEFIIRYNDSVYAVLPAGTKLADGVDSLRFSGKSVENGSNITLGEGDSAQSYDIHIEGIADDNTKPITVYLGSIIGKGISDTSLKLYHEDTLMTRVNGVADFATNNQYVYDPNTGDLVIYVDNFSVFSGVITSADEWDGTSDTTWYNDNDTEFTLTTAEQFAGFRAIVDAGNTFAGKTVTLGIDIDLADIPFDPIGFGYWNESKVDAESGVDSNTVFMGTFDGAGHTIYNLYENGWELDPDKTNYSTYTYSTAGGGLFASIEGTEDSPVVIKNLAISGAEIVFECVDMGIVVGYAQGVCRFENIVVTNSQIANYNRYTGGVVGEVSYGPYGIDTSLGYSHTFKNITVDSSVTVSGLWGSFGCGMGGVIGGKWGDATVKMENVISAPVMDVYNDVVSAYQWYAFRGCGMLIGHTEEPYSDGRHSGNATASFLTCENVKVYYGDWVNYHYYEFENQDNTTGQKYPWVRAEEGKYCDAFSNIRYGVPTHNGVKVSDLTKEELKAVATGYTPIVFDQLYGADRGMYGQAAHEGVTVLKKNVKTIYIQNNLGWENLKVHYWYVNGNDTWTNLDESGLALTEENGVYKVDLPAYAFAFKITADGDNETRDFYLSEVTANGTYNLDFEHVHYFAGNKCDCGAVKQSIEHEFTLGEDGEAGHKDSSSDQTTYTETNGDYTLSITNGSKFYPASHDEQGNASFKLGTGSAIGQFAFTVPNDVERVIIYVAGYKDKNATIEINGVQHEITTLSNNGEYTAIEVDTSETKTVLFTTVEVMGEPRCMINTISFVTSRVVEVHNCDETQVLPAVDPTCTVSGLTEGKACSICGKVMAEQTTVPATGHTEETILAVDATCTKNGLTEGTRCSVCKEDLVKQEIVISTGHNYVEGTCLVCGEAFPTTSGTYTYVFSDYTAGVQYAEGEVHKLDEYVTVTTYDCHFTDELRIYSSLTNDGYAIIYSVNPITTIGVNAGNKADTLNIYVSDDGENWSEQLITISVTSTSYKDYEVSLNGEYKYLKLDVAGANQVRIKSMTLTTVPDCAHASTIEKVIAPTCTEAGRTDTVCSSCGKVMSTVAGNPATGHVNTTTTTDDATCTVAGSKTITCDDCKAVISTETIPTVPHIDVITDNDHNCDICGVENVTEHNYVDGTCDCGEKEIVEPSHECESKCAECGKCTDAECNDDVCANKCEGHNVTPMWTLVTDVSKLQAGDQIIIVAKDYNVALSTTQNSNNRGQASVTKNGNTVTFGDNVQILVLEAGTTNGTFAFYTGSGYLYAASSGSNHLKTQTTNNANGSWKITIAADGTATIVAQGSNTRNTMQYNQSSSLFACYASASQKAIVIFKLESGNNGGSTGGETPPCTHTNTSTTTQDATCTEAGSTTVTCDDCGETISTEAIEATGHNYVDGTCSVCGAEDPNAGGETKPTSVTMNIYANKGTTGTNTISWTSGDVTVTNNKASSSTAIRTSDSDHFRVYAKSEVVISAKGGKITQVVITCTSSDYANVMKKSAENAGCTANVSGSVVTITVNNAESITLIASAQTRLNKVEVTYTK